MSEPTLEYKYHHATDVELLNLLAGDRDTKARHASWPWDELYAKQGRVLREAADELTRLRAENERLAGIVGKLPNELRRWWSFDEYQQHTHSWHDREDFIEELNLAVAGKRSLLALPAEAAARGKA